MTQSTVRFGCIIALLVSSACGTTDPLSHPLAGDFSATMIDTFTVTSPGSTPRPCTNAYNVVGNVTVTMHAVGDSLAGLATISGSETLAITNPGCNSSVGDHRMQQSGNFTTSAADFRFQNQTQGGNFITSTTTARFVGHYSDGIIAGVLTWSHVGSGMQLGSTWAQDAAMTVNLTLK